MRALALLALLAMAGTAFAGGVNNPGGGPGGSVTCGNAITGCPSGPLTTTVTLNGQTGTTYPTATTDAAKTVTLTNASPVAVSLSVATTPGFGAGFGVDYENLGAGAVTITPTTSQISTLGSIVLAQGQAAFTFSDGTNYWADVTLPLAAANTAMVNNTGAAAYPIAVATTGTGSPVAATSPTLVTPTLGVASGTSLTMTTTPGSSSAPQLVLNSTNTGVYSPGTNQICFEDVGNSCKGDYGITGGGLTGFSSVVIGSNAASYELSNGAASSTVPTLIPDRASTSTGMGASASGALSLIEVSTEVARIGTGSHFYAVGFGTAAVAETGYACYNSASSPANEILLDTVTCISSLEWMKNIKSYMGDEALAETMKLKPFWYTWNQKTHPTTDRQEQPGLGAMATEKVDKRLVVYTPKGKLKGVRYEQMTALLVADIQKQQHEIEALQKEVLDLKRKR